MSNNVDSKVFLFSIDLEDVRDSVVDGKKYREAVPELTAKYLDWLNSIQSKATFFVVGNTARYYPDLIREIAKQGHEIACHTDMHIQLTNITEAEFRKDCDAFFDIMDKCGVGGITGFRAPIFSLTEKSKWSL